MSFNTLEEAQAEILRLNDELTERTNERDTLSHNYDVLQQDNDRLRTLNQNYFNKLSAQYSPDAGKTNEPEKEAPTCEEYANTLNI